MNDILKLLNKYDENRSTLLDPVNDTKMFLFLEKCYRNNEINREFFEKNKELMLNDWVGRYFWYLEIDNFNDIFPREKVFSHIAPFSQSRLYKSLTNDFTDDRFLRVLTLFDEEFVYNIILKFKLSDNTLNILKSKYNSNDKIIQAIKNWQ